MPSTEETITIVGKGNKAKHYRSHRYKSEPRPSKDLSGVKGKSAPDLILTREVIENRRSAAGNLRRRETLVPTRSVPATRELPLSSG